MALIVVSYLLRPMMTELWHWYALSFIQYLGFSGASILPAGRLVGIWFQRSRGRVMGITLMGNNFGGITFPPLTTLALGMSWHWAFINPVSVAGNLPAVWRDRHTDDPICSRGGA